jgi:lysophospholipase L1-like esterase
MIAAARTAQIAIVLGLLLPCTIVRKRPHLVPQPRVADLNAALRLLAAREAIVVADYFAPLVDPDGRLRADCTDDGLHPNAAGYAIMAPVARAALAAGRPTRRETQ